MTTTNAPSASTVRTPRRGAARHDLRDRSGRSSGRSGSSRAAACRRPCRSCPPTPRPGRAAGRAGRTRCRRGSARAGPSGVSTMTPRRVRELLRRLVPGVAEAAAGQPRRSTAVAGQEMPGRRRRPAGVALEVRRLLRRGRCGRVARVEADGDDLEVASRFEREDAERAREAVEHLGAEHRAAVVGEDQHDGRCPK